MMAFRETERFAVELVSDSLKTFSAMVEQSDLAFDHSLSIQQLSRLTSVI